MWASLGINGGVRQFTKTGWTEVIYIAQGGNRSKTILARIADAADVAASTFDFTTTNSGSIVTGAYIARATGTFSTVAACFTVNGTWDGGALTHNLAIPITPQAVGTLMVIDQYTGNDLSSGGYAIANNNPTWTERLDTTSTLGDDCAVAFATATSTAASDTGNVTTTSSADTGSVGVTIFSLTEGAVGPTGVKTFDGVTQSTGIKTYFSVAIASTKTVDGIS